MHISEKIFLTGFMGSGKSTHGKKLASVLRCKFIDLDSYIEKKEGQTVQEIFSRFGEILFREKETKYVEEITSQEGPMVVSLGGGTVCFNNNISRIISAGILIYIEMPPEALHKRLLNSVKERPLLKNKNPDEVLRFITQTLKDREKFYKQAQLTVKGLDLTTSILKENIESFLKT